MDFFLYKKNMLYRRIERRMNILVFKEIQAMTNTGQWYTVRIMPYRTHENVIDGVVITFADITALKQLEISLRENEERLQVLLGRDNPEVRP
jgi:hypothetical protein